MTYILFALAFLIGLINKKSKLITMFILAVMFALSAYCYECADQINYRIEYSYAASDRINTFRYRGYTSFIYFFGNTLGLSYEQYRIVFFIIVLALLTLCVRLLTENINFVLSLYLIFPYAYEVVQMKQFIADVLALLSVVFLFMAYEKKDGGKNGFIILLLFSFLFEFFAISMHFSTVYFVVANIMFIFFKFRETRYIRMKVIVLAVAAAYAINAGLFSVVMDYMSKLGLIGEIGYLSAYGERRTHFGIFIPLIFIALMILTCSKKNTEKSNEVSVSNNIRIYVMTAILTLPILMLNTQYDRILRVYIVLVLAYVARTKLYKVDLNKVRISPLAFYAGCVYGIIFYLMPLSELTLIAILNNNLLFQ